MSVEISVLITTRNRLTSLERQFTAIEEMDTAGLTFEILVVDNGSTDGTYEWLKRMAYRLPVRALWEPRPGKNRALNRALPEASGSLIVFTDDDTIPVPGWLREYHEALGRWPEQNIFCGPIEPRFPRQSPYELCTPGFRYAPEMFSSFAPAVDEGLITRLPFGPNFAVRSRILRSYRFCEDVGPSDDPKYTMGSETELLQRLTAGGEKSVYLPGAKVSHIIRVEQVTLRWLKGRGFRFGRSVVRLRDRDTTSTRLFGAPRYLWKKLLITGTRCALHQVLQLPQRWESAFTHKMIQGQIHEYRKLTAGGHQLEGRTQTVNAPGSFGDDHEPLASIATGPIAHPGN